MTLRFRRARALAVLLLPFLGGASFAASLEGGPIAVNTVPGSGTYDVLATAAIDLPGGGFGAAWSENVGGANTLADRLKVRWYRSNRTPFGAAFRVDAQVAGRTPESIALQSGVRLGEEEHLLVWHAIFGANDTETVGRFFDNRVLNGAPLILDNVSAPVQTRSALGLRNGKALVSWYRDTSMEGLRAFGRIVTSDTQLGTPGKDLNVFDQFLLLTSSLDVGFAGVYRHEVGDQQAIGAQVFNASGGHEGEFIELTGLIDDELIGFFNVMGLTNGNFVFVRQVPKGDGSKGDLTAQIYTRQGDKVGQRKTILRSVPMDVAFAITYVPGDDFLISVVRGPMDGARFIEYRRFDEQFNQVGTTAKTDASVGLVRGGFRLLSNNKLAQSYRIGDQVYLQIVQP